MPEVDDLIRVVEARFKHYQTLRMFGEVVDELKNRGFGPIAEAKASKLMQTAAELGVFQYSTSRVGTGLDDILARRLEQQFEKLDRAIVVRIPPPENGYIPEVLAQEMAKDILTTISGNNRVPYNLGIHDMLAREMAKHVLSSLRDGDRIGFGSGRGPFMTSFHIGNKTAGMFTKPLRNFKKIMLQSLTGRVSMGGMIPPDGTFMDADDSLGHFARICASPTLKFVNVNIDKRQLFFRSSDN